MSSGSESTSSTHVWLVLVSKVLESICLVDLIAQIVVDDNYLFSPETQKKTKNSSTYSNEHSITGDKVGFALLAHFSATL